ncbi:MAG: AMP-binding protein, partial [Thermoplasmata archaeon]
MTPPPPAHPWIKFYEPGIPENVEIPAARIPDLVQKSVERVGKRPAIIFYGARWSYLQLWAESGRFAAALRREGLKAGDRIALYLPNVPEYPIAYLGALRAGLTVVQVNPLFLGDDLATLLEYSQPSAIVTLEILYPNLTKIQNRFPTPLTIVGQLREFYPGFTRLFVNRTLRKRGMSIEVPTGPHLRSWGSVMQSPGQVPGLTTDPSQEVAVLQYTGGTTGIPKAAMLSHRNLIANAMQCRAWFGNRSTGQDVVLASVPMFHIYGLTVALNYPLFEGATIVLQTRPDVAGILKLVNRYHPTQFPGVPALYQGFNQHPKVGRYRLRSIRVCVSGSA